MTSGPHLAGELSNAEDVDQCEALVVPDLNSNHWYLMLNFAGKWVVAHWQPQDCPRPRRSQFPTPDLSVIKYACDTGTLAVCYAHK